MTLRVAAVCGCIALFAAWAGAAEFRFPMPEFSSGYERPAMHTPPPALIPLGVDLALFAGTLAVTGYAVLRRRSRGMVLAVAVFSVAYFGFYRKGCVCSVGSIQNVLNAFIGDGAPVPLVVAVFFALPVLVALYFGRIFCAAVCPLGAVQELCAVRPAQVPRPVETVLGTLAHAYLGITVVGIVTGSGFLVCRYDPFIGFFRQGGSFNMLMAGGILLVLGAVIARPYCRFLCPYGVLLRWASLFSRWHASITPAACIQCRLCETACPYNAIEAPAPETATETRRAGKRRVAAVLLAAPAAVLVAALAGMMAHGYLARLHPTVWLAERVAAENRGQVFESSIETDAFRASLKPEQELYAEAEAVRARFRTASAGFGAFLGLVFCARVLRMSVVRKSRDYAADRGACLSCARCFAYCPVEKNDVAL